MGTGALKKETILRDAGLKLRPIKTDGQLLFPIWKQGDSVRPESENVGNEKTGSTPPPPPKFTLDDRLPAAGSVFNWIMLAFLVVNLVVGYNTVQHADGCELQHAN